MPGKRLDQTLEHCLGGLERALARWAGQVEALISSKKPAAKVVRLRG
jgi:hypothetical protein